MTANFSFSFLLLKRGDDIFDYIVRYFYLLLLECQSVKFSLFISRDDEGGNQQFPLIIRYSDRSLKEAKVPDLS